MEWIKCSDRLPEICKDVLLYMERDAWDVTGRIRKRGIERAWQCDGNWHCDGCSNVVGIAWMPLPDPPTEF